MKEAAWFQRAIARRTLFLCFGFRVLISSVFRSEFRGNERVILKMEKTTTERHKKSKKKKIEGGGDVQESPEALLNPRSRHLQSLLPPEPPPGDLELPLDLLQVRHADQ